MTEKTQDQHPMDHVLVRKLEFDYQTLSEANPVWSRSSPLFSIFANALTLHVPYFERYLVRTMVKAKRRIEDPRLVADVEAILGQEAHHANAFINYNKLLASHYPAAAKLEIKSRQQFAHDIKNDDFKRMVGFTAGYETFTFLAGMNFLDKYERWMGDSDPIVKAMWVWHQVEEVEHAAVAFDVYKYFFAEDESYRRKMVLVAFWHIVSETAVAYFHMCKAEGYLKNPWRALKATAFITRMVSIMMWHARPVLSVNYHPRKHPLATTKQNKIAVSWRRFHKEGGDVLQIDRTKMVRIMGLTEEVSA